MARYTNKQDTRYSSTTKIKAWFKYNRHFNKVCTMSSNNS